MGELLAGIIEWAVNAILNAISYLGYPGIFFLMALESACVPIPSEVVMPFSGYLAYSGTFSLLWVTLAGSLGCLAGSLFAYYVGYHFGRPFILKYGRYFLLNKGHVSKAEWFFAKYGDATVFISRLLPIIRTFISLPAGIGKMNVWKFSLYTFIGSVPWCFALAYIGYFLGPHWETILEFSRKLDILVIVCIVVIFIWYVWRLKRKKGKSGK